MICRTARDRRQQEEDKKRTGIPYPNISPGSEYKCHAFNFVVNRIPTVQNKTFFFSTGRRPDRALNILEMTVYFFPEVFFPF
jgi:hypothetical protein